MSASLTSHQYAFIERVDEHPNVLDLNHYIYHKSRAIFIISLVAAQHVISLSSRCQYRKTLRPIILLNTIIFHHQLHHLFILEGLATEVAFEHADLRNRVLEGLFSESDVFECIIANLLIAEAHAEVFGWART